MNKYEAGNSYSDVERFNRYAGQLENVTKESIALQLDLIQEEYLETVEAFDYKDPVELLDGAIDMFVVVSGLLQKLAAAGYDVAKGMHKVTENNLSKFPASLDGEFAAKNNYILRIEDFAEEGVVYSYRDGNGKLRKPPGFESVVLTDCAPMGWFV